ncbi:hypothetical protein T12_574 [Trichinella patagoniensis]|uniref:Uncharacterized protein n=1 Tax=Trichinella patagoniensis TaxID=990121 RepID=A0A0V1AB80_9BILA|nr:hypothetical protein T12_574 [Trichinella patagoniensis]
MQHMETLYNLNCKVAVKPQSGFTAYGRRSQFKTDQSPANDKRINFVKFCIVIFHGETAVKRLLCKHFDAERKFLTRHTFHLPPLL